MIENTFPRRQTGSLTLFINVFVFVFLLVSLTTTLVTFRLPDSFASTARVAVDRKPAGLTGAQPGQIPSGLDDPRLIQTASEFIQSEMILRKVVEHEDLNSQWGKKYAGGVKLKTWESLALLKSRLDVRPIRNTNIIQIRSFSESPKEAAAIANAVTKAYADYAASPADGLRVQIVDSAYPGTRPVRPNKPLNITLGAVVGIVLGLGFATLVSWLTRGFPRKQASPAPAV